MPLPESAIGVADRRLSMTEPRSEHVKWSAKDETVYEDHSEDGMNDETLQDVALVPKQSRFLNSQGVVKRFFLTLLPSPILKLSGYEVNNSKPHGPTAYLDGMRGVASFCVFLEHVAMRFHPLMFQEYGDHPYFWQWPIVRLLYSGSTMVAIFFVISGFSLSLRPLEMIYEKDWERLYHTLSSATFRRAIRIVLPPVVITFIIMLGVRMHLYDSKYSGTVDMDLLGPIYRETFWGQLVDWLEYVFSKLLYPSEWATALPNVSDSDYAAPLYTISKELWCSFILFLTMVGLGRLRAGVRFGCMVFLILFSSWSMRWDIQCFLAGMVIAELHVRKVAFASISQSVGQKILSTVLWSAALVLGLFLASIPHTHGSYGSHTFGYQTISVIVPWNSYVFTSGTILIVLSIANLPFIQRIFTSAVPKYLGQISFALYLIHWPMMAVWGWSVPPTIWKITGDDTDFRHALGFGISLVCITPPMIWVADLFWRAVDLKCIRLGKQFEKELLVQTHI